LVLIYLLTYLFNLFDVCDTQNWIDNRLTWNPAEYDGINSILLAPNYFWTTDMLQYNT